MLGTKVHHLADISGLATSDRGRKAAITRRARTSKGTDKCYKTHLHLECFWTGRARATTTAGTLGMQIAAIEPNRISGKENQTVMGVEASVTLRRK